MTRRLTITIESKHCALVKGYGGRDLLTELRGRPPVWATLSRAWVTTEAIARDLTALAESRGWVVDVETMTSAPLRSSGVDHLESSSLDPGRGLW